MPELDIQKILQELVKGEVEFLIIGGVAVGYHGHIRATKDVDVVPAPDSDNLKRLAGVLRELDAQVEGAEEFADGEFSVCEKRAKTEAQAGPASQPEKFEVSGSIASRTLASASSSEAASSVTV